MTGYEIVTERLLLCPSVDQRDLDIYVSHLIANKEEVYLQYGEPYSEELIDVLDFHSSGVIYYSIFLKDTNTMVGYVGIYPCGDEKGLLEFYIFSEYRRMGYGKEAVLAMVTAFFEGNLTENKGKIITVETLHDNMISRRFLESVGAKKVSTGWRIGHDENGEDSLIGFCYYEIEVNNL